MHKLIFNDYRDKLIEAIKAKDLIAGGINEPLTLIDGFILDAIHMEVSLEPAKSSILLIPKVILAGEKSGRLYYFAAKSLIEIPNLEPETEAENKELDK